MSRVLQLTICCKAIVCKPISYRNVFDSVGWVVVAVAEVVVGTCNMHTKR